MVDEAVPFYTGGNIGGQDVNLSKWTRVENVIYPGPRLMCVESFVAVIGDQEGAVDEVVFFSPGSENVASSLFGCRPIQVALRSPP